jgi:hypothetical protein
MSEAELYRYHPKKYIERGAVWYRMFWDRDRKWLSENRYAGQYIASGHFFSVSPVGALAEMEAYQANLEEYELIRIKMSIDNLLDLTNIEAVSSFYEKHFDTTDYSHPAIILDSFLDQQRGGDRFNAFVGQKALSDGYNGIVFFGARAINKYWEEPGSMKYRDLSLIGYLLETMREDEECINVVVYFGHNVARCTHTVSFIDQEEITNNLFSAPIVDVDKVFLDDPARPHDADLTWENLRSRVERVIWRNKPGIKTVARLPDTSKKDE